MRGYLRVFTLALLVITTYGCTSQHSTRAAVGSGAGGALGAYVGSELGGRTGAVIGGGLGAAAGSAVATESY